MKELEFWKHYIFPVVIGIGAGLLINWIMGQIAALIITAMITPALVWKLSK